MVAYPHIEERNERYYIEGKRVRVASLAYVWNQGASPEAIAQKFSVLTNAEIYAAIAFYLDHRDSIDRYEREDQDEDQQERSVQRLAESARFAEFEQRIAMIRDRDSAVAS